MNEITDKTENKQKIDKRKNMPHLFKKGQSGNPSGRPKGSISITTRIKKELNRISPQEKITYLEILVKKILKKAIINEDKEIIKLIWNYIDGMPKQALEYTGAPFKQIIVVLSGKVEDKLGKRLGEVADPPDDVSRGIPDQ